MAGTLALIVAASQYWRLLRQMWQPGFRTLAGVDEGKAWYPPILSVTCLLILIGIFCIRRRHPEDPMRRGDRRHRVG